MSILKQAFVTAGLSLMGLCGAMASEGTALSIEEGLEYLESHKALLDDFENVACAELVVEDIGDLDAWRERLIDDHGYNYYNVWYLMKDAKVETFASEFNARKSRSTRFEIVRDLFGDAPDEKPRVQIPTGYLELNPMMISGLDFYDTGVLSEDDLAALELARKEIAKSEATLRVIPLRLEKAAVRKLWYTLKELDFSLKVLESHWEFMDISNWNEAKGDSNEEAIGKLDAQLGEEFRRQVFDSLKTALEYLPDDFFEGTVLGFEDLEELKEFSLEQLSQATQLTSDLAESNLVKMKELRNTVAGYVRIIQEREEEE